MLRNQQPKASQEGASSSNLELTRSLNEKEDDFKHLASSIGSSRLPIVDAIRVLCSFIIICAHLDMLFRQDKTKHRRLTEDEYGATLKVSLKCISATVVQGFFNLSGLVVAYQFLTNRVESFCSSLLARPFRMIVPLALVQVVDLGVYLLDLGYFNYQSKPKWQIVEQDFSSPRFVFSSSLNGPLWVIEDFFYLPYAIFPILSAATILRLSLRQRTCFFVVIAFFTQCFVVTMDSFLDRLVSGTLGVACAFHLYGDEASEVTLGTVGSNILLILGATLPWNPIVPIDRRIWVCRVGAPCAIVLVHRVVRRWQYHFSSLIDKLAYAGPYTFQVYIWHHVVYGVSGKTFIPFLTNDTFILQVACIPLVWATVGTISALAYNYVERPAAYYVKMRWIKKYTGPASSQKSEPSRLNDDTHNEQKSLLLEV